MGAHFGKVFIKIVMELEGKGHWLFDSGLVGEVRAFARYTEK